MNADSGGCLPLAPSGLLARLPEKLRAPAIGLPAREPTGVPVLDCPGRLSLSFFGLPLSLISAPEPAISTSLPEPDPPRGIFRTRFLPAAAAVGEIGRDVGCGVGCEEACLFLAFLRDVSVPLASEPLGDPRRLREVADFFSGSVYFGRPEGVLLPFDEPESFCWFFSSSAFFFSSSFWRSVSLSSELWISLVNELLVTFQAGNGNGNQISRAGHGRVVLPPRQCKD